MLCKKVCERCVNRHSAFKWDKSGFVDGKPMDTENWKEGKVQCPRFEEVCEVSIEEPPPKWCPYAFEHGVAKGMSK